MPPSLKKRVKGATHTHGHPTCPVGANTVRPFDRFATVSVMSCPHGFSMGYGCIPQAFCIFGGRTQFAPTTNSYPLFKEGAARRRRVFCICPQTFCMFGGRANTHRPYNTIHTLKEGRSGLRPSLVFRFMYRLSLSRPQQGAGSLYLPLVPLQSPR